MSKPVNEYAEIRTKAVEAYFASGSFEEVAGSFNVCTKTLRRWVKWFEKGGKENLHREGIHKRHPKRHNTLIEQRIVRLKERKPYITVSEAKNLLEREGTKISRNGIWSIWKRYGLAGFNKEKASLSFLDYITVTSDTLRSIKKAEKILKKGDIKQAAHILNTLPPCSTIPFLDEIPDRLLSLPRRVEKLYSLFGIISFSKLKKEAKKLRKQAEDKKLFYLSVRIGIVEALSLIWLQESEELLILIYRLQGRLSHKRKIIQEDPCLRFILSIMEGQAYGNLLQIKKALRCARRCRMLIRSFPASSEIRFQLVSLFTTIGHRREALELLAQMDLEEEPEIAAYSSLLAIAGEYRTSLGILKKTNKELKGFASYIAITRALCHLGQGKIHEALSYAELAVRESEKEGFRNQYHIATLILGASYAALNEKKRAMEFLKRPIPVLKKFRLKQDLLVRQALLGKTSYHEENITPGIKLALLLKKAQETLKIKNYRKAYNYAQSQKIMVYSQLYLLFLPESVHHILSKGKPTYLPSRFLRLPVFQKDIPTYHLKFLGSVRIYRNGRLIREHLSPKEAAFLIYLCLRQGKEIPLASLYRNFWQGSKNPERTFSHFLVNIRKYLKLSLRSLYISKEFFGKEKSLHFSSHITTDYQYYEETLAQAKALLRAGQWGFAKREFIQAFKLFRGEPFKKMYDDWSDDKRLEILFSYETEVLSFAKELRKRGRNEEAEKLLKKAEKDST